MPFKVKNKIHVAIQPQVFRSFIQQKYLNFREYIGMCFFNKYFFSQGRGVTVRSSQMINPIAYNAKYIFL